VNRRILSAIIAVLGLLAIVLAVCSATVWRPSATAKATLAASPTQNYVVTQPGVLSRVDSKVTVTATADSGEDVFLAVGHSADVNAWLANDPYVSVTGMESWEKLSATDVTTRCGDDPAAAPSASGDPNATPGPTSAPSLDENGCTILEASNADPATSDLWQNTVTDKGSVTLEVDAKDTDMVVLAATDGSSPAPNISLSWPRKVSTPWLVPGLVLGGLLLLVGVFLLLIDIQMRRADEQRRARSAERAARLAQADGVSTAGIPQIGDPNRPLSRREMREKERAEAEGEEWIDPRTGRVYLGGVEAPEVPQASDPGPAQYGVSADYYGDPSDYYGQSPDWGGAAQSDDSFRQDTGVMPDYAGQADGQGVQGYSGEGYVDYAGQAEGQGVQGYSGEGYVDYAGQADGQGVQGYSGESYVDYAGQAEGQGVQGYSGEGYVDYAGQAEGQGVQGYSGEGYVDYAGQAETQSFSFPAQAWPAEHRRPRRADRNADAPSGPESDEEHA